jgi:hypothetical protein
MQIASVGIRSRKLQINSISPAKCYGRVINARIYVAGFTDLKPATQLHFQSVSVQTVITRF